MQARSPGLAAVPLSSGIINSDMLRTCWPDGAGNYPAAAEWAKTAALFLLQINCANNGEQMTVPVS